MGISGPSIGLGVPALLGFEGDVIDYAPDLWIRADMGLTNDGEGLISAALDYAYPGRTANVHNASAATTARPTLTTNPNGSPTLAFNGTSNYLAVATGSGWDTSTSHSWIFVIDPGTSAATPLVLWDNSSPRIIIRHHGDATHPGWTDSGGDRVSTALASNALQVLGFIFDAADTGSTTLYRDGAVIQSGGLYGARNVAGTVAIGARYDGTSGWFPGNISAVVRAPVASAGFIAAATNWARSIFGTP